MKDRNETANQILKFVRQSFEQRATEQDMLNGLTKGMKHTFIKQLKNIIVTIFQL